MVDPLGFKDLDMKLAGFQKSDLIILAARPLDGKDIGGAGYCQASRHEPRHSRWHFLIGNEPQLVDRMLAAESRVDSWETPHRPAECRDRIPDDTRFVDKWAKAPIYIDDQPANNILKMRSISRRLKSEKGLGLIVDYLQLMAPTNTRASDSMVQQVTEISRSLKHLARELKVPALALGRPRAPWNSAVAVRAFPTCAIPAP